MASGDTLCVWLATNSVPPQTNMATLDTRNNHPVLDFDGGATNESAYFEDVMPSNYAGGGITFDIYWMATTAITGNVKWDIYIERMHAAGDDMDADSFTAEQSATTAAVSPSGQIIKTTIPFTSGAQMDSIAAGEPFRIRLERDVADAADTMNATDAELSRIVVRET